MLGIKPIALCMLTSALPLRYISSLVYFAKHDELKIHSTFCLSIYLLMDTRLIPHLSTVNNVPMTKKHIYKILVLILLSVHLEVELL
jgi:hypothetical protein